MSSVPVARSAASARAGNAGGNRLAIPASRLFVLLFLSTEVMFFAGVISVYLILRIGSGPRWPNHAAVHVHPWIGGLNTLILLASSLTMTWVVSAVGKGQAGRAKRFLLATLLLGTLFLAIKGGEYAVKIQYELYPRQPELAVFDAADLTYLAAAQRQLTAQRAALLARGAAASTAAVQVERLERIKLGAIDWTGRVVRESTNPLQQNIALQSLSYLIEPTQATAAGTLAYLHTEIEATGRERQQLQAEKSELQTRIDQALAPLATAGEAAAPEQQAAVTTARERLSVVNTRLGALDDRLWVLNQVGLDLDRPAPPPSGLSEGLNRRLGVHLPYVLPGANRWIAGYWLLTGCHALHLLAGLLVMGILACRRLDISQFHFAHNLGTYWHFVDLVWIVVFVLVYLT